MKGDGKAFKKALTVESVLLTHDLKLTLEEFKAFCEYFGKHPYKSPWDIVHSELERRGKLLNSVKDRKTRGYNFD